MDSENKPENFPKNLESYEEATKELETDIEKSELTEFEKLRLENELLKLENEHLIRVNEILQKLSTKDPLTGLENRRGFEEEVGKILPGPEESIPEKRQSKSRVSFLILDVDNFKEINDLYGHDVGDKILEEAAFHLKRETRDRDIVSRWGGEEFLVAFSGADEQDVINKFYNKDNKRPEIGFETEVSGQKVKITMSGGLTSFRPGEKVAESLRRADQALYHSKGKGKNQISRYDETATEGR